MVANWTARSTFTITPRGPGYDMACNLCQAGAKAWDWKRNAMNTGFAHSFLAHGIYSERGQWAADNRFASGPLAHPVGVR